LDQTILETSSGFRFVGGDGSTPWQAVVLVGVGGDAVESAQREYVREVVAARLGWRPADVTFRSRTRVGIRAGRYERLSYEHALTGERARTFFDVSSELAILPLRKTT
jgi:hypothetical protein